MASAYSTSAFQTLTLRKMPCTPCKAHCTKPTPSSLPARRRFLFLTSGAALSATFGAGQLSAKAEDIGLFGIRKRIKEVEKEAEEIVEKGVEAAEKGVEAAEKSVEAAEEEIESAVSFSGLAQAGVVAGAEVLGVVVASSVVNGILGPEGQQS